MKGMEETEASCSAVACLEKKEIFIRQYLAVTERIKRALEAEEIPQAAALIGQRQGLIRQVEEMDMVLEREIRERLKASGHVPEEVRRVVFSSVERLKGLLLEARHLDEALQDMLREEVERIRAELCRIQSRRRGARGYGPPPSRVIPRFLDTAR